MDVYTCDGCDSAQADRRVGFSVVSREDDEVVVVNVAVHVYVSILPSRFFDGPDAHSNVVPVKVGFATIENDFVVC